MELPSTILTSQQGRIIIAFYRQGTQQHRPESPTVTPLGVRGGVTWRARWSYLACEVELPSTILTAVYYSHRNDCKYLTCFLSVSFADSAVCLATVRLTSGSSNTVLISPLKEFLTCRQTCLLKATSSAIWLEKKIFTLQFLYIFLHFELIKSSIVVT